MLTAVTRIRPTRLLSLLAEVVVVAFINVPMAVLLWSSFTSVNLITIPPVGFSLKWYVHALTDPNMIQGLAVSLGLGSAVAVLAVAISLAAVVGGKRSYKGKRFLQDFALSPLILPEVALAAALFQLFLISGILKSSFFALLLGHLIITIPYSIRVLGISFLALDRSYDEIARNLGANPFQAFSYVTLPLIKPGLVAAFLFTFVTSFDDTAISVFLSSQYTYTLPVVLLGWATRNISPILSATSGLLTLFTVAMMLIADRVVGIDNLTGFVTIHV